MATGTGALARNFSSIRKLDEKYDEHTSNVLISKELSRGKANITPDDVAGFRKVSNAFTKDDGIVLRAQERAEADAKRVADNLLKSALSETKVLEDA